MVCLKNRLKNLSAKIGREDFLLGTSAEGDPGFPPEFILSLSSLKFFGTTLNSVEWVEGRE
jgi:hypothetical protein